MADARFFNKAGPFSLATLAEIGEAELADSRQKDRTVQSVAPLSDAGPNDISFLDNRRYLSAFQESRAGACIVDPAHAEKAPNGMALLLTAQPYRAYARIAAAFHPPRRPAPGVHVRAQVDPSARLGEAVSLAPGVVIGAEAAIGDGTVVEANAVIGEGVELGEDCWIGANASLSHCIVGARAQIHPGVRIGQRGFGFDMSQPPFVDVPQLGRVIIGDDVEIGANSTIDRGAGPDTVIGDGCKIDNLVQVGHNVRLGRGCVLVAQSGVAGSTVMEDYSVLAAQAGLAGHLTVGKGAQIGAASGVMRDVPAGARVLGLPAMPVKEYFRLVAIWQRLLKTKGKTE